MKSRSIKIALISLIAIILLLPLGELKEYSESIRSFSKLLGLAGLIIPVIFFIISIDLFKPSFYKLKDLFNHNVKKIREHLDKIEYSAPKSKWKVWRNLKLYYLPAIVSLQKSAYLGCLGHSVLLFWSAGWILYYIAIWGDFSRAHTLSGSLLYSAMSALDLFLVDINGNIIDNIKIPYIGSVIVALICLIAVCASVTLFSLIIGMFLSRLVQYSLGREAIVSAKANNHIYIFFGPNDKAEILAKDITKNDSKRSLVLYVDFIDLNGDDEDGWSNIVKVFSTKRKLRYDVIDFSQVIHLSTHITIPQAYNIHKERETDFWSSIDLDVVNDILEKLPTLEMMLDEDNNYDGPQVHIFLLSDDRDKNVLEAKILSEVMTEQDTLGEIPKTIYCSTRKDCVSAVIEEAHAAKLNNLTVRIIDDANLSISHLKSLEQSYPVKYVDWDFIEDIGTAKDTFNSMIIGFGETGRDALRYLYEFSAIPMKCAETPTRIPFKCNIIDPNIENLKGPFIAGSPNIFNKTNQDFKNGISDSVTIDFHGFNHRDLQFYELLSKVAADLKFVVICAGSDEENLSIAVTILKHLRREGKDFSEFRLFIRAYEEESFSHLESIVSYYNKLYSNTPFKETKEREQVISIFGKTNQIYTYSLIIEDKESQLARQFHNSYKEVADKKSPDWDTLCKMVDYPTYIRIQQEWKDDKWEAEEYPEALFDILRQINENKKNFSHLNHKIDVINRFITEYNGHHREKQINLSTVYDVLVNLENETGDKLDWQGRFNAIKQVVESKDLQSENFELFALIYNLCVFEHLRWNASHELLGFTYGEKKDFKRKKHNCLVDWDSLDQWTPIFDYLVVENCLRIKLGR